MTDFALTIRTADSCGYTTS